MQHSRHNKKPPHNIVQVAVPAPLYSCFDYLSREEIDAQTLRPGCRVQVPFGRRSQIGVVLGHSTHTEVPASKLKAVQVSIDAEPILPDDLLKMLKWAASYYQYPIGEVIHTAMPALLRKGKAASIKGQMLWQPGTQDIDPETEFKRAPRISRHLSIKSSYGK